MKLSQTVQQAAGGRGACCKPSAGRAKHIKPEIAEMRAKINDIFWCKHVRTCVLHVTPLSITRKKKRTGPHSKV